MKNYLYSMFEETGSLNTEQIILNILVAVILGGVIYLSYYFTHAGGVYSKKFNVSLITLTVLTATVMTVIGNNIALSLGMVGALSIVRFRTAIKDPMDLVFLFWSISVGIICGAGLAEVAVILSLIVTLGILLLDKMPAVSTPMLLVVNADSCDAEEQILAAVRKYSKYSKVKSRNMSGSKMSMIVELRTKNESQLIKEVNGLEHMLSVSLLAHDGEATY